MRRIEGLVDPFAPAEGAPPQGFAGFVGWVLAGSWGAIGLLAFASLLTGGGDVLAALAVGWVIDRAAAEGPGFLAQNAVLLGLIAVFFALVRPAIMAFAAGVTALSIQPAIMPLVLMRLHRHTLGQALGFFDDDYAGRLSQKQMQTASALTSVVSESCNGLIFAIAALIGSITLMGGLGWTLALTLVTWTAGYGLIVRHFLPRLRERAKLRAAARAAMTGQIVDTLTNMATVKLFAHAAREEAAAQEAVAGFRAAALDFGRLSSRFRLVLAFWAGVLPVAMIGVALWLWSGGTASAGDIAVAGMISTRLAQMSGWLSMTAMELFSNVGEIEDGMRTLTPAHAIADRPGARDPGPVAGAIHFEDVSFRYGRAAGGAGLDRFALRVRAGEKVALVGRSGAGKSTALALLLRLYEPASGRVLLDGTDIADLTQDGLRRQVGMVRQDTAMFNRSALDNILYGNPDAGVAAARQAARLADADAFLGVARDRQGREGYAAHLGERGVKLSGGQRQRVALARAILKDAPVLLLDEATSALDSETEGAVQAALVPLMEGRTVIAVAHRLSTIAHMDRIVVMEAGRVVEEGSHAALLARGGLYARFWSHQSGGFLNADAAE